MFTLVEFIAIMPGTVTSDTLHCTCIGHLGLRDTDRIVSISCCIAQGGKGKNILCHFIVYVCRCNRCFCQNNIANVNYPFIQKLSIIICCWRNARFEKNVWPKWFEVWEKHESKIFKKHFHTKNPNNACNYFTIWRNFFHKICGL